MSGIYLISFVIGLIICVSACNDVKSGKLNNLYTSSFLSMALMGMLFGIFGVSYITSTIDNNLKGKQKANAKDAAFRGGRDGLITSICLIVIVVIWCTVSVSTQSNTYYK